MITDIVFIRFLFQPINNTYVKVNFFKKNLVFKEIFKIYFTFCFKSDIMFSTLNKGA